MKHLNIFLIIFSAIVTLLTYQAFEANNVADYFVHLYAFSNIPESGYTAKPTSFFLIERNATNLAIVIASFPCLIASFLEIKYLMKIPNNSKSVALLIVAFAIFYMNYKLFLWNS